MSTHPNHRQPLFQLLRRRTKTSAALLIPIFVVSILILATPAVHGQNRPVSVDHLPTSNNDVVVLEYGLDQFSIPVEDLLANDPPATGIAALTDPAHGSLSQHFGNLVYSAGQSLPEAGIDSFLYTLANDNLDQGTVYILPETYSRPLHIEPIASPIFNHDHSWAVIGNSGEVTTNGQDPIDGPYDLLLEGGTESLWLISVKAKGGGTTTGSKTGFEAGPGGYGIPTDEAFVLTRALDDTQEPVWELHVEQTSSGTFLQAISRDGYGGLVTTPPVPFLNDSEPERVLFYWWAASGPGLRDGHMALFLDQQLVAAASGIGWNDRPLSEFVYGIGDSSLVPPAMAPDHTGTSIRLDNMKILAEVEMPGHLPTFADGFESGDFSGWRSANEPISALAVTQEAALSGNWGLEARPSQSTSGLAMLGLRLRPQQSHLRARFLLDPRELTVGLNPAIILSASDETNKRQRVQVRIKGGPVNHLLAVRAWDSQLSTWVQSDWFPVSGPEPHQVEVKWWDKPIGTVGHGGFRLWLNGTRVAEMAIPTSGGAVNWISWGLILGHRQAVGRLFLDDLQVFW
ncbi:MAG: hypothetical protein SX243_10070 [Acidobacteriota bacterium]|nr:hypothetical protein [Acidobacteriota bacterium]